MIEQLSIDDIFLMALSAIGFGMWLLIKGGDATVDAATVIAQKFNISKLLIGFTIVAFGTSLPELLVSINANFKDSAGIALGNVIGSNIANVLLVIGAAAFICPILIDKKSIRLDSIAMIVVSFLLAFLLVLGHGISSFVGIAMVVSLLAYVGLQYQLSRKNPALAPEVSENQMPMWRASIILVLGLASVALGADVLVRGAITVARILEVPEAVIGLTVIAIGTSLPELSTSIAAALKKESGIAIGNVLGSNVFNILLIIGAAAGLKAIPADGITPQMVEIDVWVMTAIAVIFGLSLIFFGKIGRLFGLTMLIGYAAYITALYFVYS